MEPSIITNGLWSYFSKSPFIRSLNQSFHGTEVTGALDWLFNVGIEAAEIFYFLALVHDRFWTFIIQCAIFFGLAPKLVFFLPLS